MTDATRAEAEQEFYRTVVWPRIVERNRLAMLWQYADLMCSPHRTRWQRLTAWLRR